MKSFWLSVFSIWIVICCSSAYCTAEELLYCRLTEGFWQVWSQKEDEPPAQLTFSPYDKRSPSVTRQGEIIYHTSNNRCFRLIQGRKEEELLADLWPVRDLVGSPKTDLFVFSRFRTDIIDQSNLWLFNPSTNQRTLLTSDAGIQYQPAWSYDGSKIAYSAGAGPRGKEIFIIHIDGMEKKQLTRNQGNDFVPNWSPDGTKIVYSSNVTDDFEIWVMNAEGKEAKQLTKSPGLETRPVFSPDGTRIAFTSNRSGKLEIWMMNADGSNPQKWFNDEAPTCDPFWF